MKTEWLRHKSQQPPTEDQVGALRGRRSFLQKVGIGAVVAAFAGGLWSLFRSLIPNVLYEEPQIFKVGSPLDFPVGVTFLDDQRLFIARDKDGLHAISAVCTHLGCTVKMISLNQTKRVQVRGKTIEINSEFHCPCHGSKYYGDGTNYAGPAPRPLAWIKLELSPDDGQLVVDLSNKVGHDFRLKA